MEVRTAVRGHDQLEGIYTSAHGSPKGTLVLLPGSGPTTRDGITAQRRVAGVRPPFAVWADMLSQAGYASIRYDKHGATYAERYLSGDIQCRGIADEYLLDLEEILKQSQRQGLIHGPLILLGHSLGAIAALTYAQNQKHIYAVAAISAPVEVLSDTVKRQFRFLLDKERYNQLALKMDQALQGRETEPILGQPAVYWRDYAQHTLERLLCQSAQRQPLLPVLLLHGGLDPLLPISYAKGLQQQLTHLDNVQWHTIAEGDHFLMVHHLTEKETSGEYRLSPLFQWLEQLCTLDEGT